jgi:hypothetical protein
MIHIISKVPQCIIYICLHKMQFDQQRTFYRKSDNFMVYLHPLKLKALIFDSICKPQPNPKPLARYIDVCPPDACVVF